MTTISLTFDDGLPCQRDHALPLLRKHGLQGTFFLIQKSPYEIIFPKHAWVQALLDGHEIGSHSVNHYKAAQLNPAEAHVEVRQSKEFLEGELKTPVKSFCYPFTDAPKMLQEAVRQAGYIAARGGRVAREDKHILRGDGFNRFNVPCLHIAEAVIASGEIYKHLEEAVARGSWLTLMFHGVGPDTTQWDNVLSETFNQFLTHLKDQQDQGRLQVRTFSDAARSFI